MSALRLHVYYVVTVRNYHTAYRLRRAQFDYVAVFHVVDLVHRAAFGDLGEFYGVVGRVGDAVRVVHPVVVMFVVVGVVRIGGCLRCGRCGGLFQRRRTSTGR